jgi:hypothetical protein
MCGVGKKQIHDMSLNNESSAALQRTLDVLAKQGNLKYVSLDLFRQPLFCQYDVTGSTVII